MNWIIAANSNIYDHSSSFEHYSYIDWRQNKNKFKLNDIVYIYCTRPLKMIQFKCRVELIDLDSNTIRDDREYWKDEKEYFKSINGKFMRLRLIEQVSNKSMTLENLKNNGLKSAPQGPIKLKNKELIEYIETNFSDDNQTDFFPDLLNESITEYEGAKKTITVNKYERSSKARENAIYFHGLTCTICNLNFQDKYGEIGKDFIHIHHITPIHEIGENYKINYKNDLVPVCPNCHSMLHRKINGIEPSIAELRSMIKK